MGSVKTAISIKESLYEQVDQLARELDVPRSHVFVMAVEAYIERYQNQQLLAEINRAYEDVPTDEEQDYLDKMRRQHRRVVSDRW